MKPDQFIGLCRGEAGGKEGIEDLKVVNLRVKIREITPRRN